MTHLPSGRALLLALTVALLSCWLTGELSVPSAVNIQPASTKKVKKATVYFKVTSPTAPPPKAPASSPSKAASCFTNAHVVGMLHAQQQGRPKRFEICRQQRANADEFKLTGMVLGVDRENDLAMVRVHGRPSQLPEPLAGRTRQGEPRPNCKKSTSSASRSAASLGKEITACESSVSSFPQGRGRLLFRSRSTAACIPATRAAPWSIRRGVVVGVSVAGIRGTQINFAVPGEKSRACCMAGCRKRSSAIRFRDNRSDQAADQGERASIRSTACTK